MCGSTHCFHLCVKGRLSVPNDVGGEPSSSQYAVVSTAHVITMRVVWYAGLCPFFGHSLFFILQLFGSIIMGIFVATTTKNLKHSFTWNTSRFLVRVHWILELNTLATDILSGDAHVVDSGLNHMSCISLSLKQINYTQTYRFNNYLLTTMFQIQNNYNNFFR